MARDSYNQKLFDIIRNGSKIDKKQLAKKTNKTEISYASESNIQQSCVTWFKCQYPKIWEAGMLFHISNEGVRLGGMGKRIKREGIVRGVADLCLSIPRHGYGALYIEMKRPHCYQSPEQKRWQKNVEHFGNKYMVCKSLEEFIVIIKRYLEN